MTRHRSPVDDRPGDAGPPAAPAPDEAAPAAARPAGPSTIRRVLGGVMVLLSTQPITWAASLLLTIYLPRYLDSYALGELSIALSASAVVGTLASFGLATVLTRTVAGRETDAAAVVSASLVMVVGLSTLGAVLTVLLGLTRTVLDIGPAVLGLAMAAMIVTQLQAVLFAVLAGQQRLGEFAWVNAVSLLISAVGSVGVLMLGGGAAGTLVVSLVVLLLSTAFLWRRVRLPFDRSELTRDGLVRLGKAGLPFLSWNVLLRVRGDLDSIVLGGLLSIAAVGWWSAAQRIISIPIFVPVLVTTPLLPALASVRDDREVYTRTLRRTFELTVIVTVGISAAIAGFAPLVPATLGWAESYAATVPVMQVMAPALVLVSISMVLGTGLIGLGDERRWLLVNALATGSQYAVLFVAVPVTQQQLGNGSLGAAVGRIAAELIMVAGALLLLPRGMIRWTEWFLVARTALVAVATVGAVLRLLDQSLVLAAAVGVLTYGFGLVLLRVVRPADLATALRLAQATIRRRAGAAPAEPRPAAVDAALERGDGAVARP